MTLLKWMRDHLAPPTFPTAGDSKYLVAMAMNRQVQESAQARSFPDPFSQIVNEMRDRRGFANEHDAAESSDIYAHLPDDRTQPVIRDPRRQGLLHQFLNETKAPE